MDEKVIELLQQLVDEQKKQTDILRQNLWRIKFSLFTLMLLMTFVGLALGTSIYWFRSSTPRVIQRVIPAPSTQPARPKTYDAPLRGPPIG
jgi:hypothetical protein